jgi:hypothetical protein
MLTGTTALTHAAHAGAGVTRADKAEHATALRRRRSRGEGASQNRLRAVPGHQALHQRRAPHTLAQLLFRPERGAEPMVRELTGPRFERMESRAEASGFAALACGLRAGEREAVG